MCPEPPQVHKNLYTGYNTRLHTYMNFCLFKQIPMASIGLKLLCIPILIRKIIVFVKIVVFLAELLGTSAGRMCGLRCFGSLIIV